MPHSPARRLAFLTFTFFMLTALLITLTSNISASTSLPPLFSPPHVSAPLANCVSNIVAHDIVYIRAPRFGDNDNSIWQDTVRPLSLDPGADLRLLHPNCTEEKLFPLNAHQGIVDATIGNGSVTDPNVSFDGKWVVFAYYHDLTDQNIQRCATNAPGGCLSYKGADIYRLNLETRAVVRLTHQEFTPNTGNSANFDCTIPYTNCPNIGTFNVNPAFVATSDTTRPSVAFVSSRNNFLPPTAFNGAERTLQLFVMDWDGKNQHIIGHLNQSQALHPFQLRDGRLLFTSWENQGARDSRQFNLWFIHPDGTNWNSGSGFGEIATGHHFATQMPNQDIVTVRYYNLNNNGFGDLARYPLDPSGPDFRGIDENGTYMPFERQGQVDLTNWARVPYSMTDDFPAPCAVGNDIYNDTGVDCPGGNQNRVGKVTHPAALPNGGIVLVYTKGPANHNFIYVGTGRALPFYDGGIYLMAANKANGSALPTDLQKILNDPNYNEQFPRPVVTYQQLFGVAQPNVLANLQNNGALHNALPANTPLGLVGSSALIWRDTIGRLGPTWDPDRDPFNTSREARYGWEHQGADAGIYSDDDIYAVRVLAMLPQTDRSYPNGGRAFYNVGNERLRILGEIPARHEGVTDGNGNTDTSFLAKIPADIPFTFQTLDRNGMVLNMAQTWHQLRPGEVRYDCGGCHAHTKEPLEFHTTVAGQNGFTPADLALKTTLLQVVALNGNPTTQTLNETQTTLEYLRDIKPLLETKCAGCHLNNSSDGKLNLHDDANTIDNFPGTYFRLVRDYQAQYGNGVPANSPQNYFISVQLTRYLRAFQSRQSLLIWKLFGARLDGRANGDRDDDLDYTPDAAHANYLTWNEKMKFARWIDLGAPIDLASNNCASDTIWGWCEDDLRPTLWASPTIEQGNANVNQIGIGAYDLEAGLKNNSLSVKFNVTIAGNAPGYNFAQGVNIANGGTVNVPLGASVNLAALNAVMTVQIQDNAGHTTEIVRAFSANAPPPATATPTKTPPPGSTATPTATATNTPPNCDTPNVPSRTAPPNSGVVSKQRVLLNWSDVNCATRYEIVVRQGNRNGAEVFARTDVILSKVRTTKLTRGLRYVWRVRACDASTCSAWSRWWKFTMQ